MVLGYGFQSSSLDPSLPLPCCEGKSPLFHEKCRLFSFVFVFSYKSTLGGPIQFSKLITNFMQNWACHENEYDLECFQTLLLSRFSLEGLLMYASYQS